MRKHRGVATRLIFYSANEARQKGSDYLAKWMGVLARSRAL